jgi:predicted dehydrogenase/uncharacterized protein (DUF362 family)
LEGVILVKLGIVGCGRIATSVRLPSLEKIKGVEVVAAADTNEERLHENLEKFHVDEGYVDYRRMLEKADIEAVYVCTPPETHFQIVKDSISHGKHVFCEKPIAATVGEGLAMKKMVEAKGKHLSKRLVLMPAHNFIFTPCFEQALESIKKGEIGTVQKIQGCSASNLTFYRAKTDFRIHAKGGVIEDQLPHVIYLTHELGGPLERIVSVEPLRKGHTVVDDVRVEATLKNGVAASLSAKWAGFVPGLKFEVTGDLGQMKMDLLRTPYNLTTVKDGEVKTVHLGRRLRQYLDVFRNRHPSYLNEQLHFVECVEGTERERVTIEDGVELAKTLSGIMTIYEESPYSPIGRERAAIMRVEEDIEGAVQKSIALIGGLNFKKNASVVIKPNVCYHKNVENMVITDPRVLEAIVNTVKRKTKNVIVVESDSRSGTADERVTKSGMMDTIEKCNVEFLNLSEDNFEEHEVGGLTLRIPETVSKADFFINAPKVKTCNIEHTFITIAMKNMFGTLANKNKPKLHSQLMEILLFLNRTIRQNLIIADGIVGMQGLGPMQGEPVNLGLIVSGLNPVTVDAVCCHVMGINPYGVEPLWKAYKTGVGEIDMERIQVLGETIDAVKTKFSHPVFSPGNVITALKTSFKTYTRS